MIVRRIVVDDGRTKRDVALVGTVTVGRDPACQVSDPDPLLSRRHAEFVATAHEVTIRDLSSRNGVLVNGAKVPERVLVPGDLVQIGRLHCLYIEETAPAPAPTRTAPTPPVVHERTIALIPPLDQAFDEPIAPIPNIPTGNEPTFVPAGWRAEAMQGFDDTQPGGSGDADAAIAPRGASPNIAADDIDATRAPASLAVPDIDIDATMAPARAVKANAPDDDMDATGAVSRATLDALLRKAHDDETMAPRGRQPAGPRQAQIITGPSLLVSEASASGLDLFGMSPQALVGASIPDLVVRVLGLMAAGEGPSAVSLTVERRLSDGQITITFTPPKPAEE